MFYIYFLQLESVYSCQILHEISNVDCFELDSLCFLHFIVTISLINVFRMLVYSSLQIVQCLLFLFEFRKRTIACVLELIPELRRTNEFPLKFMDFFLKLIIVLLKPFLSFYYLVELRLVIL